MESGTAATRHRDERAAARRRPPSTIEVHNPATGELIEAIPVDSPEAVAATVARVRANQPEWEAMGIEGRYHWLGKLRDWLLDNARAGARHDAGGDRQGPRRRRQRAGLPRRPDQLLRHPAPRGSSARRASAPTRPCWPRRSCVIQYRPHPVVGIISPWNFPLILSLGDSIPALQAGRAVVIKPSEFTPLGLTEVIEAWKQRDRRPRRLRLRPGRRRDRRRPGRRGRLRPVHRLRPHRPQGDGAGGGDADPGQPRARRQGPDDRPRRRRPRPRRQRRGLGRDDELRPDLHVGRADLRRGARLRPASSTS